MNWNWKRNRSRAPDPENATPHARGGKETDGDPHARGGPTEDDSDNNDKFWKLFLEEAVSEAQWKVSIRQTELDSLLVFAGLFAGVVSAFLIDLRSHLRPDPQLAVLKEIASALRNGTVPDSERATNVVITAGALFYGSLVVTLIGALWGVLAKGWLGEILRETPNNPADRALERWRRDKAAKHWYMDNVITGVPLLIQVGLAMFLTGFVVQSFDDNHDIGLEVLVYVVLGACAYALFTFLPRFYPDCPYRTPLTTFLHLVSPDTDPTDEDTHNANTDSKIKILMSRLNRSSNDEIFCSAAAMLDVKLESLESKKWYDGVVLPTKASAIAEALSVRLKSFAHRVQTIPEGPSLSILKDAAHSGGTSGQALVGALYSPIEQGITCLRILLKSIEASMSSEGNKSPWIKKDIDSQWRLSKTFPETWRLLSLSIHITRLVAKKADYNKDDIAAIDWESMIRKTFSDQTLRSISGASACRGLLHGENNLKRICALGLAMFIEIETSGSGTSIFLDKETALEKGKVITERLWSELVKIWKDAVVQLLGRNVLEWDEPENTLIDSDLLTKELYKDNIKSFVSKTILEQLQSGSWATRKEAVRILTKLSKQDVFRDVLEASGAIPKVITMLKDDDNDVRLATVEALSTFGDQDSTAFTDIIKKERALPQLVATLTDDDTDVQTAAIAAVLAFSTYDNVSYQDDIKLTIPTIIKQLNDNNWSIREKTIRLLKKLSEFETIRETINAEGTIPSIVNTLEDGDADVRAAAVDALQAFSVDEFYQDGVKLSILTITKQLDNESWEIRLQNVQILKKLSELETFRKAINEEVLPKLIAKLKDDDSDVRTAVVESLQAFSTDELYQNNIKLLIPTITKHLDNEDWGVRQKNIQMLVQLFKLEIFRETLNIEGIIPKFLAKLADDDSDVRAAAFDAVKGFSTDESYSSDFKSSIPDIMKQLDDENWNIRQQAIGMLEVFSKYDVFNETLKTNEAIKKLIVKLKDDDEDVRTAAVEALAAFCTQDYFKETTNTESCVSKLFEKLSDDNSSVRSAAFQAMSTLSMQEDYKNKIKSLVSISTVVSQLDDESWSTRRQAVDILAHFATDVDFQEAMHTEKTVSKLAAKLTSDTDEDVRTAIAQALSVFGEQETFQKELKSEKAIPKLTAKLSDSSGNVRSAAQSTMLALSTQVFYQSDVKSTISSIMEQLEDTNWDIRQQIIQTLEKLSELSAFQETLKIGGSVAKLVAKLDDGDDDVRAAAAQALSGLGTKDTFKEKMKTDKVVPKLVSKLTDDSDTARDAVHDALLALGKQKDTKGFLETVVSTLTTVDKPVRTEAYKLLTELKDLRDDSDDFLMKIDLAICELLIQMKDKDISFIRRSIAILTETADKDLQGDDLKTSSATNRSARDVVENVVRSKLVYEKNSPDRNDVVLTLSRLAKNEIFLGCMRPAIPALIEAVSSTDQLGSAWSTSNLSVDAILTLSTRDEFRTDLVPAVQKLIQKLTGWDEDEAYPLELIKALPTLAQYEEFQNKLKRAIPILMEQLHKDVCKNTLDQDSDKNKVAFYQEVCKLVCKLCETNTVGRDLVPYLTRVLSNMHVSLTGDLLDVVTNLINHGNSELTMNDRIALASSLRIVPPVADALEVQVCKLTIAALLDEAHKSDPESTEYSTFMGAVLGNGNDTVKSKLSTLVPPAPILASAVSIK